MGGAGGSRQRAKEERAKRDPVGSNPRMGVCGQRRRDGEREGTNASSVKANTPCITAVARNRRVQSVLGKYMAGAGLYRRRRFAAKASASDGGLVGGLGRPEGSAEVQNRALEACGRSDGLTETTGAGRTKTDMRAGKAVGRERRAIGGPAPSGRARNDGRGRAKGSFH